MGPETPMNECRTQKGFSAFDVENWMFSFLLLVDASPFLRKLGCSRRGLDFAPDWLDLSLRMTKLHHYSAVHAKHLTGDVTCFGRRQKRHSRCDVLRSSDALQRNSFLNRF